MIALEVVCVCGGVCVYVCVCAPQINCISRLELHEQLEQLMTILEQVPVVIFDALRKECQAKADKEQNVAMDTRLREIEESSKEGVCTPASLYSVQCLLTVTP